MDLPSNWNIANRCTIEASPGLRNIVKNAKKVAELSTDIEFNGIFE